MSEGVNWMDIWVNCKVVGLGVEGGSLSAVGTIIFGGGGAMMVS